MFMDFSSVEAKSVKNVARETAVAELKDMLIEKFGEANVTQIDSGAFAVSFGEKDGKEVCIEFKVTGKDVFDRTTEKKGFIKAFDRIVAGQKYQEAVDKQTQKKADAAKKKEEKIERDKQARAKAKAEKEAKKAQSE